ncbi:hypothetical protein [Halovivax cerinus]|uniref:Uncharacterized protein n=1 Tax=Halovivax cerinus TaxID=1487865 RepID=A0ABD5NM81_9EURY|nr:hypothetical protein [Halovivax cerinus]
MTTWADLFERAAPADADVDAIRDTLHRQRTDDRDPAPNGDGDDGDGDDV